jgi:NitT/TauT family transport system substrate-binding protein
MKVSAGNKQCAIRRRHLAPRILTIAALALFACAGSVCAQALRIAYTSIAVVYGPLWLTKEAGIFKKYNIDPEFIYIAGGPPSLQALIAGDVAISFTAGGATVAANLQGSDVVLLGATIDSLPFELWSTPAIKSPEQLKGTKLGVSRIGATTDFVAHYLLKKWNLQPDKDVAIFQTGSGPQIFAAIKGGSVQSGVLSTGPETISAEAGGFVRLADVSTSGLVYPFGPFAARQAFLKSQPDLVTRFMKAYVEGIHRFKSDKAAALAVLEKYTKQKTTPAAEKIYEIYSTKYFKRAPEATPAAIQTILEELSASRAIPAGTTPQRFADSRFIRELVSSGFIDALYKSR